MKATKYLQSTFLMMEGIHPGQLERIIAKILLLAIKNLVEMN